MIETIALTILALTLLAPGWIAVHRWRKGTARRTASGRYVQVPEVDAQFADLLFGCGTWSDQGGYYLPVDLADRLIRQRADQTRRIP